MWHWHIPEFSIPACTHTLSHKRLSLRVSAFRRPIIFQDQSAKSIREPGHALPLRFCYGCPSLANAIPSSGPIEGGLELAAATLAVMKEELLCEERGRHSGHSRVRFILLPCRKALNCHRRKGRSCPKNYQCHKGYKYAFRCRFRDFLDSSSS